MRVKYSGDRISVSEAAEMLSMNEQVVRVLMQKNKLPIGIAEKSEKAERNFTYYIYRGRVESYLKGLDLN